jgi:hypothetical protein
MALVSLSLTAYLLVASPGSSFDDPGAAQLLQLQTKDQNDETRPTPPPNKTKPPSKKKKNDSQPAPSDAAGDKVDKEAAK